jgi:formate-dependent phosphoribosylglycinamide formyltransferase (GAR transformylase)
MELDRFLVCGLDSLGQHCVLSLKEFGVNTIAIDSRYRDATRTGGAANLGSTEFSRYVTKVSSYCADLADRA